jgi:hypothetical protein
VSRGRVKALLWMHEEWLLVVQWGLCVVCGCFGMRSRSSTRYMPRVKMLRVLEKQLNDNWPWSLTL